MGFSIGESSAGFSLGNYAEFPSRCGMSVYQAATDKGSLSLNRLPPEFSEGKNCGAKRQKGAVLAGKS
jgi:hypothetical protein